MAPGTFSEKAAPAQDQALNTLLSAEQRAELPLLIAKVAEVMRKHISDVFDASVTTSNASKKALSKAKNPNVDTTPHKGTEEEAKARKLEEARAKQLSQPKQQELKNAALDYLQKWQTTVVARVEEALEAKETVQHHTAEIKADAAHAPDTAPPPDNKTVTANTNSEDADAALIELYPPLSTPLLGLPKEKRILLLHALLLLLLSLEHYIAPSRILLLYISSSLHLPLHILAETEVAVAQGLAEGAHHMSGDEAAKHRSEENRHARMWKVGLAGVAGAAIIGVTGGLAAPLVAAGVGSVMAGLGLEATVAVGLLGSLAESSVVVGTLFGESFLKYRSVYCYVSSDFVRHVLLVLIVRLTNPGAYGFGMTSKMMDEYAKEVQDFAFLPLRSKASPVSSATLPAGPRGTTHDISPEDRRLRVTLGISGWLTNKEDIITPWRVLGHQSEVFALRWELEALMKLGTSMEGLVKSYVWSIAKKEIIERTIFASLMDSLWPLALLKVRKVVDNPFSVAMNMADKAGLVLADALIKKVQGERPVTLVGYSLGARVIYSCLMSLAERKAFGLVESVALMGTPAPSNEKIWRALRSVVSGRLVNIYSENDYILAFLYRTSSIQLGIAGIQEVEDVKDVENVNVSELVSGHLRYQYLVGSILQKIGWEDIDLDEVAQEEETLSLLEEEEKKERDQKKGEENSDDLEKKAKEKTNQVNIEKDTAKLSLGK